MRPSSHHRVSSLYGKPKNHIPLIPVSSQGWPPHQYSTTQLPDVTSFGHNNEVATNPKVECSPSSETLDRTGIAVKPPLDASYAPSMPIPFPIPSSHHMATLSDDSLLLTAGSRVEVAAKPPLEVPAVSLSTKLNPQASTCRVQFKNPPVKLTPLHMKQKRLDRIDRNVCDVPIQHSNIIISSGLQLSPSQYRTIGSSPSLLYFP